MVSIELPYYGFTVSTRVTCNGFSGFATGSACDIWYHGSICHLYVSPTSGKANLFDNSISLMHEAKVLLNYLIDYYTSVCL